MIDRFVQYNPPPPEKVPVDELASILGLVDGLRVQVSDHQWRCGNCSNMQPKESLQVWVPDGVRVDDPSWSVEEVCRQSIWNGHSTAWCQICAPKKTKMAPEVKPDAGGLIQRIKRFLTKGDPNQ